MRAEMPADMMVPEENPTSPDMLRQSVADSWGIRDVAWQALPRGHTNSSHRLDGVAGAWILRASWPHKPRAQLEREARVLAHLDATPLPAISTPRICRTRSGATCTHYGGGRWLHLFGAIDGQPVFPDDVDAGTGAAMSALALLHHHLAALPCDAAALDWLGERLARVRAHPMPALPRDEAPHAAAVLACITRCLTDAASWVSGPVQWLHGDYHPGNLLFDGARLAGIVDFDEVGCGTPWLEAAFALFACCRDVAHEDALRIDHARWRRGLQAYARASRQPAPDWLLRHAEAVRMLFCAYQVLIHLDAAQRQLWALGPGIGFLACWRELRRCCTAQLAPSSVL